MSVAFAGIFAFKTTTHNNAATAHKVVAVATTVSNKIDSADTMSDSAFYSAILKGVDAKETVEKIKFLKAWRQGEGGAARNNPFNTTKDVPGTADTKYNSVGVRNYPDRQTGLKATIATLQLPYYRDIVALLRKDNVTAHQLSRCASLRKWGTGNRVTKVLALGNVNPPAIMV